MGDSDDQDRALLLRVAARGGDRRAGYATELALACASLADKFLGLPEVRAFAHPKNIGSRRVLEKARFQMMRFVPEMDRLLYRRRRSCEHMAGYGPFAASGRVPAAECERPLSVQ
jgi:hypothetical protein